MSSLLKPPEGAAPGYSREHRRVETFALAIVVILAPAVAARVVGVIYDRRGMPWTWLAVLCAWIAADFVSGLVHWMGDTWGREDWPILGSTLIRGFREHHVDQTAITHHDFVETNGSISLGLIPVLLTVLVLPCDSTLRGIAVIFLAIFSFAMFFTNEIHKWAHREDVNRPVAWLQRAGLILSPARHAVHHAEPFDRYYCITTGWLNPLLDRIGFFRALEGAVRFATGAVPRSYVTEAAGFSANTNTYSSRPRRKSRYV